MKEPKVNVVMVNWNGKKFLEESIASVLNQTYKDYKFTFVDNASTDGSVEFVRKRFPCVNILVNEKNTGVTGGMNRGFAEGGGEYNVIVDNDIKAAPDWLEGLVKAIETGGDKVGCVEGEVRHFHGVGVINGSLNILCYNTNDVFNSPTKKFYSGNCSMIIRTGIVGSYFDPDYFFYGEDVYMGWKLRLLGYDIIREPKSVMMHYGSGSASKNPAFFRFLSERNRIINFFSFYETGTIIKLLPLFIFMNALTTVRYSLSLNPLAVINLKARIWALLNIRKIAGKRAALQRMRIARDGGITPMLSCRIFPEKFPASSILNTAVLAYCSLLGIRTVEADKELRSGKGILN